jgi:hypothetical protein
MLFPTLFPSHGILARAPTFPLGGRQRERILWPSWPMARVHREIDDITVRVSPISVLVCELRDIKPPCIKDMVFTPGALLPGYDVPQSLPDRDPEIRPCVLQPVNFNIDASASCLYKNPPHPPSDRFFLLINNNKVKTTHITFIPYQLT